MIKSAEGILIYKLNFESSLGKDKGSLTIHSLSLSGQNLAWGCLQLSQVYWNSKNADWPPENLDLNQAVISMLSLYLNPDCNWKDFLDCWSTTKVLFQYLAVFVLLRRSSGLLESLSLLPTTLIFFSKNNNSTVSWTLKTTDHTHTLSIFLLIMHS